MIQHLDQEQRRKIANFCAFMGAAMFGLSHLIKKLLAEGVDVEATAANIGIEDASLIKENPEISKTDTALLIAVRYAGDVETVRLLLDEGADTHVKDAQGKTPMMIAIEHGRSELVEILAAGSRPKQ